MTSGLETEVMDQELADLKFVVLEVRSFGWTNQPQS